MEHVRAVVTPPPHQPHQAALGQTEKTRYNQPMRNAMRGRARARGHRHAHIRNDIWKVATSGTPRGIVTNGRRMASR